MALIPEEKLQQIQARHAELEKTMSNPDGLGADGFREASKEYSDLEPLVETIRRIRSLRSEIKDLESLLEDESDGEMAEMAAEELKEAQAGLKEAEQDLAFALLPRDSDDERAAMLEIRAGTGGNEAALFAGDLFRMYQRYAETHGWKVEVISTSAGEVGGYKEIIASVNGRGVFARLKYESGVHRVQRVPETESGGRIHTSAATVAVLPEAEEVDVKIEDKDLRIDVFRASGPGGQSVNTTDSAVRVTHIPTGLVVQQQDEKSQHKNRAKAMKVLKTRLYELERRKAMEERAEARKGMVGTGDRSERIRTYNFPQGRVTDHRINLTLHKLDQILAGEELDELIDTLIREERTRQLAAMGDDA